MTAETSDEDRWKTSLLRTHNLQKLAHGISEKLGVEISRELYDALSQINGYYFTTRYPGDEHYNPTKQDIEKVNAAIEGTRDLTYELCRKYAMEPFDNDDCKDLPKNREGDSGER